MSEGEEERAEARSECVDFGGWCVERGEEWERGREAKARGGMEGMLLDTTRSAPLPLPSPEPHSPDTELASSSNSILCTTPNMITKQTTSAKSVQYLHISTFPVPGPCPSVQRAQRKLDFFGPRIFSFRGPANTESVWWGVVVVGRLWLWLWGGCGCGG